MERTRNGKYMQIPYTFSFQPGVNLSTDTIRIILERLGFFCLDNQEEKKISVRINGETPVFCNFDQNGEFASMNFADIKWSMLTFIPEGPQYHKKFTNIRFRLQSFREVDRKNVVKMEEYTQLVQRGKYSKQRHVDISSIHSSKIKTLLLQEKK